MEGVVVCLYHLREDIQKGPTPGTGEMTMHNGLQSPLKSFHQASLYVIIFSGEHFYRLAFAQPFERRGPELFALVCLDI